MSHELEVDTVVFDLGRVIIGWDPYLAVEGRVDEEAWDDFLESGRFETLNHKSDEGASPEELVAEAARTSPHEAAMLEAYYEGFAKSLTGPVPGMPELVRELKDLGYRVLGLSNWSRHMFPHAPANVPVISELEGVVVSGEVGVAKPDRRIYEHLLSRFGLDPVRTVFVDDMPRNVEAARDAGIRGVVFTGADALRTELLALGLSVPPALPPEESHLPPEEG